MAFTSPPSPLPCQGRGKGSVAVSTKRKPYLTCQGRGKGGVAVAAKRNRHAAPHLRCQGRGKAARWLRQNETATLHHISGARGGGRQRGGCGKTKPLHCTTSLVLGEGKGSVAVSTKRNRYTAPHLPCQGRGKAARRFRQNETATLHHISGARGGGKAAWRLRQNETATLHHISGARGGERQRGGFGKTKPLHCTTSLVLGEGKGSVAVAAKRNRHAATKRGHDLCVSSAAHRAFMPLGTSK